jgi:hypothetical protein
VVSRSLVSYWRTDTDAGNLRGNERHLRDFRTNFGPTGGSAGLRPGGWTRALPHQEPRPARGKHLASHGNVVRYRDGGRAESCRNPYVLAVANKRPHEDMLSRPGKEGGLRESSISSTVVDNKSVAAPVDQCDLVGSVTHVIGCLHTTFGRRHLKVLLLPITASAWQRASCGAHDQDETQETLGHKRTPR